MVRFCPNCRSEDRIKSGIRKEWKTYLGKEYKYYFVVNKLGKRRDEYFVNKSLNLLFLEGLTYPETERILCTSHFAVWKWVQKYKHHHAHYPPTYKFFQFYDFNSYDAVSDSRSIMGVGDNLFLTKNYSKIGSKHQRQDYTEANLHTETLQEKIYF